MQASLSFHSAFPCLLVAFPPTSMPDWSALRFVFDVRSCRPVHISLYLHHPAHHHVLRTLSHHTLLPTNYIHYSILMHVHPMHLTITLTLTCIKQNPLFVQLAPSRTFVYCTQPACVYLACRPSHCLSKCMTLTLHAAALPRCHNFLFYPLFILPILPYPHAEGALLLLI